MKYPFAPFHVNIFDTLKKGDLLNEIIAFRESSKSTVVTLIYVLWCILYQKRNFIIICSDSYTQAQLHLANVIYELENNTQILADFGYLASDKWTEGNFVTKTGIRVMARGTGSKIRGLRHLEHRPDLFIGDDLENSELVRTKEQRDKTEKWLISEVIPAVNQEEGQVIIVGNMLHNDSLMSRLKENQEWSTLEIPIVKDGKPAWKARHSLSTIDKIKNTVGSLSFAQEYMLTPIMDGDQIIRNSWIRYYQKIEPRFIKNVVIALDPAISEKESADKSAFTVWCKYTDDCLYLLDYINEQMSFDNQIKTIRNLYNSYKEFEPMIVIEDVAYQKALIQHLTKSHYLPVKPVKPKGDKRSRLMEISVFFENGLIHFKKNHDEVVAQLVNFGVDRYDDLVDSSVYGIKYLLEVNRIRGFTKTNLKI